VFILCSISGSFHVFEFHVFESVNKFVSPCLPSDEAGDNRQFGWPATGVAHVLRITSIFVGFLCRYRNLRHAELSCWTSN